MRILFVSDTHGDNTPLDEIIINNQNFDLYLHAGDCCCYPQLLYPFHVVRGNCDYAEDMLEELIIPSPFGNILLRHKSDITAAYLKQKNIKILMFGHTHIPECRRKNGVAYINPGSISSPRSEYGSTYMRINIDKENIDVDLCSVIDHKILEQYHIFYTDEELDDLGRIKSDKIRDPYNEDILRIKAEIEKLDDEIIQIRKQRGEKDE